ncbi:hypothetical protein [Caulobacter hibisci]|uniref:Uncharacterized protein n=1 Tax=Caulobacter hibisci TaxID=2035993 RepID=A0ABS0SWB6_9CAUL|nr:hypothetical protein [Caulobacter hibisci]MBI1683706.1 hypothetical protein [Caulobacter hibisci]
MWDFHSRREWWRRHRYDGTQLSSWTGPIKLDFRIRRHFGMATGTTYQFAVGAWPDTLSESLVVSEGAFDFLEPPLRRAWPQMHPYARYGASLIPAEARVAFIEALRREKARLRRLRYAAALASPRRLLSRRFDTFSPPFINGSCGYEAGEIRQEFARNPLLYFQLADLFESLATWLDSTLDQEVSLLGI